LDYIFIKIYYMALIQPTNIEIEIEIPDKTIDGTILKRKAKLFSLVYNMKAKQLVLNWEVIFYSRNSDGSYGRKMSDLIPSYTRENVADNQTPVNPFTGQILEWADLQSTFETDPNTGVIIEIPTSIPYMLQYDWFNQVGENQDLNIHNTIRQYGLALQDWDKR